MPKRTTTAAITLLTNEAGRVQLALNAVAAPGGTITEWSVDWNDGEVEDGTLALPVRAEHAYITPGAVLIVFTVKDSKAKLVSTGLNAIVQPAPIPVPPEEGTFDALMPPSDSGVLFGECAWQYQQTSAPFVTTTTLTPSANGTKIVAPSGRIVAPDMSVWTWGVTTDGVGYVVLRNGIDTQGKGTVMKLCDGYVSHLASNGTWWRYETDGYYHGGGTAEPCGTTS